MLSVLSVPSQWLEVPPQSLLYPNGRPSLDSASPINLFNSSSDPIPNLHITRIAGLDISSYDLKFAIDATAPPSAQDESLMDPWRLNKREGLRWEEMTAKIWQGGLETINEEFVGIECIVSTEVQVFLFPSSVSVADDKTNKQYRASSTSYTALLRTSPTGGVQTEILAYNDTVVHIQCTVYFTRVTSIFTSPYGIRRPYGSHK